MTYFTKWYRLPHKTALGMILIISRSGVVIKITAGKLIQLSLMTFGDVSIHFDDIEHFHLKMKFLVLCCIYLVRDTAMMPLNSLAF